jgi:hypothetical protein
MEYRPPPKGRSTQDNVECLGLWLYGAEKTAHFLGGRRKQGCDCSYGSHVACAWAVYGCPVLPHRCMAALCRLGAIKSPLIEECPLGFSYASNGRLIPPRCAFLAFCVRRLPYYVAPQKHRRVFCSHFGDLRLTNQVGTFYKGSYDLGSTLFQIVAGVTQLPKRS